jgi:hypothetical protein
MVQFGNGMDSQNDKKIDCTSNGSLKTDPISIYRLKNSSNQGKNIPLQ